MAAIKAKVNKINPPIVTAKRIAPTTVIPMPTIAQNSDAVVSPNPSNKPNIMRSIPIERIKKPNNSGKH